MQSCDCVEHVFMYRHTHDDVPFNDSIDVDLSQAMESEDAFCEPEVMDSEDPLFILYTSGSTGKPKDFSIVRPDIFYILCSLINMFSIIRMEIFMPV